VRVGTAACTGAGALAAYGIAHGASLPVAIATVGATAALSWLGGSQALGFLARRARSIHDPISILPWGIIVRGPMSERVFRWGNVLAFEFEMAHDREGGVARTVSTSIQLALESGRIEAVCEGAAPVEHVGLHFRAYAEEQQHQLALTFLPAGLSEPKSDGGNQAEARPTVSAVLCAGKQLLSDPKAAESLGVPFLGYRDARVQLAQTSCEQFLTKALESKVKQAIDPRGLALVLAAELRLTGLRAQVSALGQCPHPEIAAIARRAAILLGCSPVKVGSLEELDEFLSEQDRDALIQWDVES
jgi:hypothetical protein